MLTGKHPFTFPDEGFETEGRGNEGRHELMPSPIKPGLHVHVSIDEQIPFWWHFVLQEKQPISESGSPNGKSSKHTHSPLLL